MLIFTRIATFYRNLVDPKKKNKKQDICCQESEAQSVIPRSQHLISRKDISENTLKVLYRLHKSGYEAYLVGGSIRDLLLGKKPKDFDVATNATPEQIKALFRNSRLVGRRFRLAHIIFGSEIIEVATFRAAHNPQNHREASAQNQEGMLLRDNVYGTLQDDILRRDFTINSLYYSPVNFSIINYAQGWQDLKQGIIRLIGDPETRYREDPVRMLRAIRFHVKLNMVLDPATAAPIRTLAPLLKEIPAARLFDESLKLLQSGEGYSTYQKLREYGLFQYLFPIIADAFTAQNDSNMEHLITQALKGTDHRLHNNKRVNPAFLFAAMLWYPLVELAEHLSHEGGLTYYDAFCIATNEILALQCRSLAIPKRFTNDIRDIWQLQLRLPQRAYGKALRLLEHNKFRAAFDLLALRSKVEKGELIALVDWWTEFQQAPLDQKKSMANQLTKKHNNRKGSHRSSRRYRKKPQQAAKSKDTTS